MKVENLLSDLSRQLGADSLELDDEGICRFNVDKSTRLTVERSLDEGIFFIYAPVGLMPLRMKEKCDIQNKLLEGNLFGQGTGHGSLGYDSSSNLIILFQEFEENNTDEKIFTEQIELFLAFLQFWSLELENVSGESLKGVHRLDDPEINLLRKKNIQMILV
jgi:Tir chaperone protein (CesT) family